MISSWTHDLGQKASVLLDIGPFVDQCHVTICTWLDVGSHLSFKISNHELCTHTNKVILLHDNHRTPCIRKENILTICHVTKLRSPNM